MATQAKITLTAQCGIVKPAERILILNAANPVAHVGRASKSLTKGLFSAADNAWFDSPVMSRDHAKMTLNVPGKTVTIQDIGSMHGTFLNGVELPRLMPSILNNGDGVVFGAEVRRGPETFPACSFSVTIEFSEQTSTGTFAFPESSDIEDADEQDEDDDDYDFSDDNYTGNQQQSSEDGASIESQPPSVRKLSAAIDLTRDDSPEQSNRIDLTGEMDIMDLTGGRPNNVDHHMDPVSVGTFSTNAPILVDSEDEDIEAASHHAAEQSDDESDDSDGSGSSHMSEELFPEGSEVESEDMVIEDSYDVDSSHGLSDLDEVGISFTTQPRNIHDNSTILLSDIRTRTQFPESIADDEDGDNESEFGLSEAGEAGLKALVDSGLLRDNVDESSESESEPESEPENKPESQPEVVSTTSVKESAEPATQPTASESFPSVTSAARYATLQNFTGHKLGLSYPTIRLPSPSDAAMVKSAASSGQNGNLMTVELSKSTAQILGDKTGKIEYFEAREVNKARFPAETGAKPTTPDFVSIFNPAKSSNFEQSGLPTINNTVVSCGNSLVDSLNISTSPESGFPTREPCSFLDKPDQTKIPTRPSSPQLDMTSAHSYNLSKHSAASTVPTPANSRGIKIDDIIEPFSAQSPHRVKRKAEEISDITEEELRSWATASSSTELKTSLDKATITSQGLAKSTMVHSANSNPTTSNTPDVRPTKRMKKLLENVGYAALGGVAVGAGLFTVLVATAPDFL